MQLKIIQQTKNPLFKRSELQAEVTSEITPKKQNIKDLVSKETSKPVETIVIKTLKGSFGTKNFKISALIYDSIEELKKSEPKSETEKPEEAPKESEKSAEVETQTTPEKKKEEPVKIEAKE